MRLARLAEGSIKILPSQDLFLHPCANPSRDTDDEAMSEGDEDDPALLRELEGLSGDGGGGGEHSQGPPRRQPQQQQQQQPPVEPLVYASANLTAVIDERIANYTQVRIRRDDWGGYSMAFICLVHFSIQFSFHFLAFLKLSTEMPPSARSSYLWQMNLQSIFRSMFRAQKMILNSNFGVLRDRK